MTSGSSAQDDGEAGLTDLQLSIMRVLWKAGPITVAQVVKALAETRPLAHTTVSTILTRLEKRGVVACDRDGRQLVYAARVGKPEARRASVASLLDRLFGGKPAELVAHLLKEHDLPEAELDELTRLVEKGRGK